MRLKISWNTNSPFVDCLHNHGGIWFLWNVVSSGRRPMSRLKVEMKSVIMVSIYRKYAKRLYNLIKLLVLYVVQMSNDISIMSVDCIVSTLNTIISTVNTKYLSFEKCIVTNAYHQNRTSFPRNDSFVRNTSTFINENKPNLSEIFTHDSLPT